MHIFCDNPEIKKYLWFSSSNYSCYLDNTLSTNDVHAHKLEKEKKYNDRNWIKKIWKIQLNCYFCIPSKVPHDLAGCWTALTNSVLQQCLGMLSAYITRWLAGISIISVYLLFDLCDTFYFRLCPLFTVVVTYDNVSCVSGHIFSSEK